MSRTNQLLVITAVVALISLIGAGVIVLRGRADAAEPLAGVPLSAADLRTVVSAGGSCPALTPARLAGQVMADSRPGAAGLTAEDWKKWAPWPGATADDRAAGITALAHDVCQLAGQVRSAKVPGDLWPLALAAYRGGLDAVVAAGGIPGATQAYVTTVGRYATWYAQQPQLGPSTLVSGTSIDATGVLPVPGSYVKAVVAAGKVCSEMPPARVAAQIMATSGFDPSRLGGTGEQGIAQFRPQTWLSYASKPQSHSPWKPADAIPALGKTMCALIAQSSGAYPKALAVFTRGDSTEPATTLAAIVARDEAEYAKDARLKITSTPGSKAPPAAASSATPSASASTSPGKAATAVSDQPPVKNAGKADYGPYFLYNLATGQCADLFGNAGNAIDSQVDQYPCAKTNQDNQEFTFVARGTDPSGNEKYWIKSTTDGHCFDLPGSGTVDEYTAYEEADCRDDDNQYFRLEPRLTSGGRKYYWLHNTTAGDWCLDVTGAGDGSDSAVLLAMHCVANDDHEWALVERADW